MNIRVETLSATWWMRWLNPSPWWLLSKVSRWYWLLVLHQLYQLCQAPQAITDFHYNFCRNNKSAKTYNSSREITNHSQKHLIFLLMKKTEWGCVLLVLQGAWRYMKHMVRTLCSLYNIITYKEGNSIEDVMLERPTQGAILRSLWPGIWWNVPTDGGS